MSLISLQNSSELEVPILSNRFIDNVMPRAYGEFVKVYLYGLPFFQGLLHDPEGYGDQRPQSC